MRREQASFQVVGMCGHRRLPSSYYMIQIQTSHNGSIYWWVQIRNNVHGVVCVVPSESSGVLVTSTRRLPEQEAWLTGGPHRYLPGPHCSRRRGSRSHAGL